MRPQWICSIPNEVLPELASYVSIHCEMLASNDDRDQSR
jgi:hypothetical protein